MMGLFWFFEVMKSFAAFVIAMFFLYSVNRAVTNKSNQAKER